MEPLESKYLRQACQSAIALYALSGGEPDPILIHSLLAYELWKPGSLTLILWETILFSAETEYVLDTEMRLAQELRYSKDLERLLPSSLRDRLRKLQVEGPIHQLAEKKYTTMAAFKAHWQQINWLKTGPKTLSYMALGLLGFKLGSLGFYTYTAAALVTQVTFDAELLPFWTDQRNNAVL